MSSNFNPTTSDDEQLLSEAYHEARWVYNQTIQLAKDGIDWDDISPRLEDGEMHYRIRAKPYNPVRGTLRGAPDNLELLERALNRDEWRVGTAEAMSCNGNHELHINVTHLEATVQDKQNTQTVVGVDINEDCVALAALHEDDIVDSYCRL